MNQLPSSVEPFSAGRRSFVRRHPLALGCGFILVLAASIAPFSWYLFGCPHCCAMGSMPRMIDSSLQFRTLKGRFPASYRELQDTAKAGAVKEPPFALWGDEWVLITVPDRPRFAVVYRSPRKEPTITPDQIRLLLSDPTLTSTMEAPRHEYLAGYEAPSAGKDVRELFFCVSGTWLPGRAPIPEKH